MFYAFAVAAFTRAESRLLYRDAVFLCRMPFCTLLSRIETVARNVASSVVLSPEVNAARRWRSAKRICDLLARLNAVFVTVCRARFSAET